MAFRDQIKVERRRLKGYLREGDPREDTGLNWTAWTSTAHTRLQSAATDDDPACMRVYATEAKVAAMMAADLATNDRQQLAAEAMIDAARRIQVIAENAPTPAKPHDHPL